MPDVSLRALLVGDRECVEDVAAWLAGLDDSAFRKQVDDELHGRLDSVACAAMREPANLRRWESVLKTMHISVQTQLSDPNKKSPRHAQWRQRVLIVQETISKRREECRNLMAAQRMPTAAALKAKANRAARRGPFDRATHRLREAHQVEFLTLYVEELTTEGVEVPPGILAELARLRSAEQQ